MVVGDDEIRDGKTQPGSLADFLGGEEWLEDALAHILRDTTTVVLDVDFRPRRIPARAQDDLSRLVALMGMNGLTGVLQQVEQDLHQQIGGASGRGRVCKYV